MTDNTPKIKTEEAIEMKTGLLSLNWDGKVNYQTAKMKLSCHVTILRTRDCKVTPHFQLMKAERIHRKYFRTKLLRFESIIS